MKRDLRESWWLVKQLVRNPPLVWGDPAADGWTERMSRREVWRTFKPYAWYSRFVRTEKCGCRYRRVTGRQVIYCMEHAGLEDGEDYA